MNIFDQKNYNPLVIQLSKGNHQAFKELHEMFYPELAAHVLSKVNDDAVAQDILHDLFYSLWKNHQRVEKIKSLPAYLLTSCRYLVMAHFQRVNFIDRKQAVENSPYQLSSESIEDQLFNRHLLDVITKEIENLPEKCRQIFKMSRESYMTTKQIATELNISESTVENQINKAIIGIKLATKNYMETIIFFI